MYRETGGKKVDIGSLLNVSRVIEQHNSDLDFHLDTHTVISGGFKFEGSEVVQWNVDGQLKCF